MVTEKQTEKQKT